jgi:putative restriction endonuclease
MVANRLSEYLELTPSEARLQWRRVVARPLQSRGEDFLPVETLLCYGLFFEINPHRYGGRNIDQVPLVVKTLAATMKRTPGSLTIKMLNLDGSRANSARLEPELFLQLGREAGLYACLYSRTIAAARDVGLGDDEVPRFPKEEQR